MNKQITILIVLMQLVGCSVALLAQQGFGTNSPNPNAVVDMAATNKGVLIPRVALSATNSASPVSSPAPYLLVFNTATASSGSTAVAPGFYYRPSAWWDNNSSWVPLLSGASGWMTTGNTGLKYGANFVGTSDDHDLVLRTNGTDRMRVMGVGGSVVGGSAPATSALLDLTSTSKGLLLPRMTLAQIGAIKSPAAGLMLYQTDGSGLVYYNGSTFESLPDGISTFSPVKGAKLVRSRNGSPYLGKTSTIGSVNGESFSSNTNCQTADISVGGCGGLTTVTGNSGYVYPLVELNGQCWFAENLQDKPYATAGTWSKGNDTGWYGYYTGVTSANKEGMLYQWSAAMNKSTGVRAQGACPTGFHIPSDCEWMYLEHMFGRVNLDSQSLDRGGIIFPDFVNSLMVSVSGTTWNNSSGFSGKLAGSRDGGLGYSDRNKYLGMWSSNRSGFGARIDFSDVILFSPMPTFKDLSLSVRCLKD